jgi:arsenate reductase
MKIYKELNQFISRINIANVSAERIAILTPLQTYIQNCKNENKSIRLMFICTHNSRRSHFSQIWAQTMAAYYQVEKVETYSAGTEVTAIYKTVLSSLKTVGFQVNAITEGTNPIQAIKFGENEVPIIGFSKSLTSTFNPATEFAAIMTCSAAAENCPFIIGASQRIPLTYEDPKAFDDTVHENEKYLERSLQIAEEMKYIFSKIL